jgi:hypothetical protein
MHPDIGSPIIPWAQAESPGVNYGVVEESLDSNAVVTNGWKGDKNQLWYLRHVSGEGIDAKYQVVNKGTSRCLKNTG